MALIRSSIFGLIICSFYSLLVASEIHQHMTHSEKKLVFGTSSSEKLPNHQVIPVFHTKGTEKNQIEIHVTLFGENKKLILEEVVSSFDPNNIPTWTISTNSSHPGGSVFKNITQNENIGRLYKDIKTNLSFLLDKDENNNLHLHGDIDINFKIRPLPARVNNDIVPQISALHAANLLPSTVKTRRHDLLQTVHHVIIEKSRDSENDDSSIHDYIYPISDSLKPDNWAKLASELKMNLRSIETIYPEIAVIVDYSLLSLFDGNIKAFTQFFLPVWQNVNEVYKQFNSPKIQLKLARLQFIKNQYDVNPLLNEVFDEFEGIVVNPNEAMKNFGQYMMKYFHNKPKADLTLLLTRSAMCSDFNRCEDTRILGQAVVGGACLDLEDSIGIISIRSQNQQKPTLTLAHELGHLLGLPHDGDEPNNYIGGPGAVSCNPRSFVMAPTAHYDGLLKWSTCSVKMLQHFLKLEKSSCLYDLSVPNSHDEEETPSKEKNSDVQNRINVNDDNDESSEETNDDVNEEEYVTFLGKKCRERGAVGVYVPENFMENICVKVNCVCQYYINSYTTCKDGNKKDLSYKDGTICGRGKHCRNKKCVRKN